MSYILSAVDLSKSFPIRATRGDNIKEKYIKAVDKVSFNLKKGCTTALVGESGCGKTTVMRTMLRLEEPDGGQIIFKGDDINVLSKTEFMKLRKYMQVVFQDPLSSLNPMLNVYQILAEPLITHTTMKKTALRNRIIELLNMVGLSGDYIWRRPFELSGGQCQRIAIARALALNPEIVFLDEPTSSLDVSVQARILKLLHDLQKKLDLTYLFITHNLSVVESMADEVIVMYLGKIVESGSKDQVFNNPAHPYTRALLKAILSPYEEKDIRTSVFISGGVSNPDELGNGCRFYPRCEDRIAVCKETKPEMIEVEKGHQVFCHNIIRS